jgi:hypothetical protein
MSIFNYYPKIKYNNITSTDLLVEADLIKSYLQNYNYFYDYVIKEGERADMLAYDIYNDSTLDWVIYLFNGIIDPYKDWPLKDSDFIAYMESKYSTAAYKLTNTNYQENIAYYFYEGLPSDSTKDISSYNYTMTPFTYTQLGSPAGWVAKSIWDHEYEINESKRNIKLLRSAYLNNFKQQFKDLFNNG